VIGRLALLRPGQSHDNEQKRIELRLLRQQVSDS
jgi:hypothetical protein